MSRIAIVAALEREVHPLVRNWRVTTKEYAGRRFKFFEKEDSVLVCGGIGTEAARRATEAVIASYMPEVVCSAGFVGALRPGMKIGEILVPRRVMDARDGSSFDTGVGDGVLVTSTSLAGRHQKEQLAASYGASAADMEASAVARGALARGVRFIAVKAVSDEIDFEMQFLERFILANGGFDSAGLTRYALLRPWLWAQLLRLTRNSLHASAALCDYLQRLDLNFADNTAVSAKENTQWSVSKS
jgi:adenosylhomocysteine nucleosidase